MKLATDAQLAQLSESNLWHERAMNACEFPMSDALRARAWLLNFSPVTIDEDGDDHGIRYDYEAWVTYAMSHFGLTEEQVEELDDYLS